ncbi:hypothetical protein Hsar01_01716 [Haloferula sargassicola]|uniref:Ribbon-helix-helix protein CopG domain-containing protein n=1 Tax=Haloferula sargassicola TaxID=490096 RepID=A0ABP9UT23_9BACT
MIENLHVTEEVGEQLEALAQQLDLDRREVAAMAMRHGLEVLLQHLGPQETDSEIRSDLGGGSAP